ncbi:MAG: hypothetical protein ACK579_00380 [Dolichospermum sp.]
MPKTLYTSEAPTSGVFVIFLQYYRLSVGDYGIPGETIFTLR